MQDKQENVSENDVEHQIDYKALYEKTNTDLQSLVAKKDELLRETKKAKQEKTEQLAATVKAEQERALKDGEYEKLWKSSEQQAKDFEQKYTQLINETKQEKIQGHALKLAIELADGNAQSAKLLSRFIQDSLSKMSDEKGLLDDSIIEAVKKEFQNNSDFAPLLGGSKASGGGALGNSNRVQAKQQITREAFSQMNPQQQFDYAAKIRTGEAVLLDN